MKYFLFRANWLGQQDSVPVVVLANNISEALNKAKAKYLNFYALTSREINFIVE